MSTRAELSATLVQLRRRVDAHFDAANRALFAFASYNAGPSLVREIHTRQVNQMAVRSLVGGCANTQTRVIAVGVESGDEWKMLRHLGVRAGQGPWFADPEPLNLPD